MPKFIIERDIPNAGALTTNQVQGAAQKSCEALRKVGPQIHWVQSYVTGDKLYCLYISPSKELIQEHAKISGFPANRISEVKRIIDDNTAAA